MTGSHVRTRFARFAALLAPARRRARDRSNAARLGDRHLRDLGVSRAMLAYELDKPLWRG